MGNRRSGEEDTSSADRLSHLPEPILHHILSFLDTKSVVQTSVLSRAWNRLWKHVPVLDLRRLSFQEYASFQWFVYMVLDLRYPLSLHKLSYRDNYEWYKQSGEESETFISEFRDVAMCIEVIQYALYFDIEDLLIDLDNEYKDIYQGDKFTDLFGTISNCNLKTLDLTYICINDGLGSCGFGVLTTLNLRHCSLASDQYVDFFSNLPSLKHLAMSVCQPWDYSNSIEDDRGLKISGPQWLNSVAC
ncbi:unnamed protein product [Linum tenue]|uniref:F-box domain-containing protein n=1 Tax=Linum tenue TaxID=586396 RepID=A0AAV0JX10_9ROSI|nr:unnamed protein product [Linum tenue]